MIKCNIGWFLPKTCEIMIYVYITFMVDNLSRVSTWDYTTIDENLSWHRYVEYICSSKGGVYRVHCLYHLHSLPDDLLNWKIIL